MKSLDHQKVVMAQTDVADVAVFDTAERQHTIIAVGSIGTLFAVAPRDAIFSISIEMQAVIGREPDKSVDADWQPFYQDGIQVALTNAHNATCIPVGAVIRAIKPATPGVNIGMVWI